MNFSKYIYNIFIIILYFLSSCTSVLSSSFQEREFISLAGIWDTELGGVNLPGSVDESRLVERTKDTTTTSHLTRLYPYEGKLKYTRSFIIPDSSEHKEWRLILERTKPTVVWLDGDSIGMCSTILSPHIYHLGYLKKGVHTITIEVNNAPSSVPKGIHGSHAWTEATQTNWNGIIGRIGVEGYNKVLIEQIKVQPKVEQSTIPVFVKIKSPKSIKGKLKLEGETWNSNIDIRVPKQEIDLNLREGVNEYNFEIYLGNKQAFWSEFNPTLYKLNFELVCDSMQDFTTVKFGIRDFSTNKTQFTINSNKIFLRGKHDGCVFPLTGYPAMDKAEWKRQFKIAKRYGINHYRFHSWTPPQAAFDAANEEGIYIQTELPYWGELKKDNKQLNDFLINEGVSILDSYGNNPSFVMFSLGNELGGDVAVMRDFVSIFRRYDNRPLYTFGSNNYLGTAGKQEDEDFFVACRVGGEVGSDDYSKHVRSTFSFADAKDGGYLNGVYPSTTKTFSSALINSESPVISHENGQFQSYPSFDQIKKYEGVLYPYNLEIFRDRLKDSGLLNSAQDYHRASVLFSFLCYKEDVEMCLRTPELGGFQLLDLQDYPGQGSAYVGLLDVFMNEKEGVFSDKFNSFCSSVVPLALFPKYTWNTNEYFTSNIQIFNYSDQSIINKKLYWTLSLTESNTILNSGSFVVNSKQGTLTSIGSIGCSLDTIDKPHKVKLDLEIQGRKNSYDLWVYPSFYKTYDNKSIVEVQSLDEALKELRNNKKVLFTPNHNDVQTQSVEGMFTPDYWNYSMFKSISEGLNRKVSPGTLSILTNPTHPLFYNFPTDCHTNWQWWSILRNSRPLILDSVSIDLQPIIKVIDNIERNHRLGLVFELNVDGNSLLVNMCNLKNIEKTPEGRQFKYALFSYMSSEGFNPSFNMTEEDLGVLFNQNIQEREISGVKNITTYK